MFNVQYEEEFANQLVKSPKHIKEQFEDMYLELQVAPRSGAKFHVFESGEDPDIYYMLFETMFAWIVYTVQDRPTPLVKVYRLVNARDLI